jgi:hypothetical protein
MKRKSSGASYNDKRKQAAHAVSKTKTPEIGYTQCLRRDNVDAIFPLIDNYEALDEFPQWIYDQCSFDIVSACVSHICNGKTLTFQVIAEYTPTLLQVFKRPWQTYLRDNLSPKKKIQAVWDAFYAGEPRVTEAIERERAQRQTRRANEHNYIEDIRQRAMSQAAARFMFGIPVRCANAVARVNYLNATIESVHQKFIVVQGRAYYWHDSSTEDSYMFTFRCAQRFTITNTDSRVYRQGDRVGKITIGRGSFRPSLYAKSGDCVTFWDQEGHQYSTLRVKHGVITAVCTGCFVDTIAIRAHTKNVVEGLSDRMPRILMPIVFGYLEGF